METLTKAWVLKNRPQLGQRDVAEMKAHRSRTGASGNCFDLAIWLWHEFEKAGVPAYAVGDFLGTPDAHVGVIAVDKDDRRFLCDLGDLWIQPIAVDLSSEQLHEGFFTGAHVKIANQSNRVSVEYHRANGKVSHQSYDLSPISKASLLEAGEISQRNLSPPLVEMRLSEGGETIHWEFDKFESYFSRMGGLAKEAPCFSDEEWARRIASRTGMNTSYVLECLIELRKKS
ncbi:MAG: hypothetical protein IPM97_01320 [Bdellovibrionaceae bacterium]|nr:hypothetical protein [Pseudobdellovibrionaceae bacterium]